MRSPQLEDGDLIVTRDNLDDVIKAIEKFKKQELLHVLSKTDQLIKDKPKWQQGMLDESSKATCDTPRKPQ